MKPVSPYKHVYFKRLNVTKTVLAVIFIEKHAKKRTRFRNPVFFSIYLMVYGVDSTPPMTICNL